MPADVALRRLGEALVGRLDEMLQEYVARMRAEVPEFFLSDDPAVVDALRESARANYIVAFNALSGGREVPEHAPPAAVAEARVAAETGVALPTLLKSYYVGHAVAWERILLEVERLDLDTETRSAVLQLTSRYAFSYIERISVLVTDEYTRARQSLVRSRDRLRARLISDLLEGLPVDDEALGYGLGQWHLAAVTWGERPEGALAALADVLEGQLLTVPGPFGTLWGWIGASVPAADGRVDRFAAPPDTRAALGGPGRGRAGFRRSHHQAQGVAGRGAAHGRAGHALARGRARGAHAARRGVGARVRARGARVARRRRRARRRAARDARRVVRGRAPLGRRRRAARRPRAHGHLPPAHDRGAARSPDPLAQDGARRRAAAARPLRPARLSQAPLRGAQPAARRSRTVRSRSLAVSAAARSNSTPASSLRPRRASRSPRTAGRRW